MLEVPLKGLQIALGLGALALGATTAVSFAGSASHALHGLPSRVTALRSAGTEATWSRYQVILDRNLFRTRLEPPPAPEPTVQASQLQVQLLGTLVAGAPDHPRAARKAARKRRHVSAKQRARLVSAAPPGSLAILRDVDGSTRSLAVGDLFAEKQARLVAIERSRIVFDHAGKLEAVEVDEAVAPANGKAARPGPPSAPAAPRPEASAPASVLGLLDRLLPGGSPETAANGQLEAYRIVRVDPASGLSALLQEGDRVRAIDGIPLQQQGMDFRVQMLLRQGSELRLMVEDASGRGREVPIPRESLDRVLNPIP